MMRVLFKSLPLNTRGRLRLAMAVHSGAEVLISIV